MLLLEEVHVTADGRRLLRGANLIVRRSERSAVLAEDALERDAIVGLLAGWQRPERGRVRVDGLDPCRTTTRVPAVLRHDDDLDPRPGCEVALLVEGADVEHPVTAERIAALLDRLAGATVLVATSDPALAAQADRVTRLHDGRLLPEPGPPDEAGP